MIQTTTINVDGKEVTCTWSTIEEFKKDWFSDDWPGPSLDDEVVSATVDGREVQAEIFKDVMDFIREHFGFDY